MNRSGHLSQKWQLRRRGRWTSERTLERYIQEGTFLLHQNQLSKEVAERLSALRRARASFLCRNKSTESPATSPYSHHVTTTCSEELTPFCAAAPSNGALPTPSRLSKRYLHHFVTWDENKEQADEAQDTSHRHTGMDYVVSRVRRPRIGDAVIFWYPKQCLALGFLACVLSNSLGPCSGRRHFRRRPPLGPVDLLAPL